MGIRKELGLFAVPLVILYPYGAISVTSQSPTASSSIPYWYIAVYANQQSSSRMGDYLDTNDMAIDEDVEDVAEKLKSSATRRKGRGFGNSDADDRPSEINQPGFETVENDEASGKAQRSVEGWILLVTGLHEEAAEDDVRERFAEYGEVKSLHLNLDRRTGFVKGYALVEYEKFKEAKAAVDGTNGKEFLEKLLYADFAFVRGPGGSKSMLQSSTGGNRGRGRGGYHRGGGAGR
ncbi:hypothetical protein SeMB42_g05241 [Synchytrium endobioticum]|uniref:RNA-binding protein 8A n=1 Tax=Synchytrium endobioticum TaxID=286115 RepID=A0A507CSQ3_9FUNG|nr:hypothetical protein SeMB42_g05241 [Synchytrium endobioticum]